MISMNVMILSADAWQMNDEKTGEVRRGSTVWYCPVENFRKKINSDRSSGTKPLKVSVDYEFAFKVVEAGGVPCAAVADCILKQTADGMMAVPESFVLDSKSA